MNEKIYSTAIAEIQNDIIEEKLFAAFSEEKYEHAGFMIKRGYGYDEEFEMWQANLTAADMEEMLG